MLSRKRIVALLLALAMLTTLFAGCGSTTEESAAPAASAVEASAQDESPAAEDAPAEAETPVSTVEEPISAEEPAEEIELGTIEYPLDAEGETLSFWLPWMPALSMCYTTYLDHPAYAAAEEFTGVEVEYVSCSQENAATEFNLMVAS